MFCGSGQTQIFADNILWSSFQPLLTSVMNLKFAGENFRLYSINIFNLTFVGWGGGIWPGLDIGLACPYVASYY